MATALELRQAWSRLALRWHPDHAGPEGASTFRELAAAYAVLSDPVTRAAYDRAQSAGRANTTAQRAATTDSPARASARAPAVMLARITGSLQSLLSLGIVTRAEANVIELHLEDDEASQGGMAMISMYVDVRCPGCAVAGPTPGPAEHVDGRPCRRCGGGRKLKELFSAWLAIRPAVTDGTQVAPSAALPGMMATPTFRIRIGG